MVIARGESLLADEAEAYLERVLARRGVKLVDENGLPGLMGLLEGTAPVPRPRLLSALRGHARAGLLVHAKYLGERKLRYMGRWDVVFQARLTISLFDLERGEALAPSLSETIEYNHLTVAKKTEDALRPKLQRFIERVRSLPR